MYSDKTVIEFYFAGLPDVCKCLTRMFESNFYLFRVRSNNICWRPDLYIWLFEKSLYRSTLVLFNTAARVRSVLSVAPAPVSQCCEFAFRVVRFFLDRVYLELYKHPYASFTT